MKYTFQIEEIESCECIGEFDDEWVYDIEIDDDSHTFIANDILVHNSTYISLNEIIENTEGIDDPLEFILQLYEYRIKDYFQSALDIYANKWNATNIQEFEMESISENAFWIAKKKYALDLRWKEGGTSTYKSKLYQGQFFDVGTKRKYTGIEIKKKSTPIFARKILDNVMDTLFKEGNKLNLNSLTKSLKLYRDEFKLQDINDISLLSTVNNYNKYILSDRTSLKIGMKCPIHIRAAGTYNFIINNSKYKTKYELIKSGDKIKYFYVNDGSNDDKKVFGFPVGRYPIEVAPNINFNLMFAKTIIDPINRFIKAMDKPIINYSLITTRKLF